jgi:SWI/SNF-related matrix-associated actin-dependent regulator of chromatin subfamily A member 5
MLYGFYEFIFLIIQTKHYFCLLFFYYCFTRLWAMLNFLLPQVFVSSIPFDKCFDLARGMVDKEMLDKAHGLMKLFSLRRLKADVEMTLPPKRELKILVPLSEFQLHFYRALLLKDVGLLKAAAAQNSADNASGASSSSSSLVTTGGADNENGEETSEWKRLQSLMMQLRKCCDHPYMFTGADPNPDGVDEGVVTSSNKMVLLDR